MASRPSFDPNELEQSWEQLVNDENSPLVNRPTHGLYTPGSVFKILTSAAALDSGSAEPGTTYECKESIVVQGNIIRNYEGKGYGNIDLTQALKISSNTYFAQLALELGRERLKEYVKRFGFDRKPSFQFDAAASFFPDTSGMDDVELAWSGIGQGKLLVTPLQIAMVGLAMANQGQIMEPYLVQEIRDSQDGLVKKFEPRIYTQPISAQTAEAVKAMMVKVVAEGTGRSAQIQAVSVAGKTGTAELGQGKRPHSWFVGFAPSQDPHILIVVIVENGGTGAEAAAPIFRKVASAYLGA
jgi:peptidoglycan glycosyltransferase